MPPINSVQINFDFRFEAIDSFGTPFYTADIDVKYFDCRNDVVNPPNGVNIITAAQTMDAKEPSASTYTAYWEFADDFEAADKRTDCLVTVFKFSTSATNPDNSLSQFQSSITTAGTKF